MTTKKMTFGIIGLGKMGGNLALQALEKGYGVVGYDKLPLSEELKKTDLKLARSLEDFKKQLERPRVIFLYIPAGKAVDTVIDSLASFLDDGDIIIDGGNSYWGDSMRRAERMIKQGIYFIDCGTSGGPSGARTGACFMVGGDQKAVNAVSPLLKSLAVPEGFVYTGPSGSGHYVKLVHNGIEFGMLQAIGEGIDLLTHYRFPLNIVDILHCWNHGSVVRSWLVELMEKMYREEKGLDAVSSYIEDTGEVNWLVNDALHMEIPIPVISMSVIELFVSRDNQKNWAKAIAMMRHGFGGHPFGPDKGIQHERKYGKVGQYPHEDPEN